MFESLAICAVAPATTTGPFPSLERLDRRDITEGYPGHPLRLGFRVVDANCQPIPGAQVEIWHTDATGDYSSYEDNGSGKDEGEGSTFLRGIQTTDAEGIGEFQTVYPGWYEGRAVHIHATILIDGQEVHTTQLYFDEAYTDAVHITGEYAQFGPPDTSWSSDGLIGDPTSDGSGISLVAAPTALGEGTLGLVNLGVAR
jgi:protocatechuate 3,4-dioxygenase beta subunit